MSCSAKNHLTVSENGDHEYSLVSYGEPTKVEVPVEINALLDARLEARANKDWTKSDELRDEIAKLGYVVKDSKETQEVRKA